MKRLTRYILILLGIMILWNTIIIKPLKIFAVFLHELGHTFMAFIFGLGIQGFGVNFNESGYTLVTSKGTFETFMIASAGYMGSILFALLILYVSKTKYKKFILGTAAIVFLLVSLRYSSESFTLIYSIIFSGIVIILYMIQNDKIDEWVIAIIGISSVAYSIYDTFVDTILYQINIDLHLIKGWDKVQTVTDSMTLEKITNIPAVVWGIIWFLISLISVYAVIIKAPKKRRLRK